MGRLQKILDTGAEPAPRHVRRRVGVGVVVLVAALLGWAIVKHATMGDLSASEISAGIDDLAAAVRTQDPNAFEAAEEHFVDAASVSVVDRYPAFLISATRKIARPDGGGGPHHEIAAHAAQGDFLSARAKTSELQSASPQAAEYWARLIDELELRLDE